MYMKKNQKPSVGSTKTELNEYINILENRVPNCFQTSKQKRESKKIER